MKFAMTEVATIFVTGPKPIPSGIISKGRSSRFVQKIPSGGIHAVLSVLGQRLCSSTAAVCEIYSTQALHIIARKRLIQGATMHPRRANSICERDGIYSVIPKLNRVRITA
jgi:hypothetical protein